MEPKEVLHFDSASAFREWLEAHHSTRDELWVGYWKKGTGRPSLTWQESVDEALCFGWIDGIRRRVDDEAYTNRFTPRRKGSTWSRRNLARYAELESAGRIHPAGAAAYERRVEEDPRHPASRALSSGELPPEFVARLKANEAAWLDWAGRPPGYRRQVARWVMSAKQEKTRLRRLAALIEDSAAGRKVKPLR